MKKLIKRKLKTNNFENRLFIIKTKTFHNFFMQKVVTDIITFKRKKNEGVFILCL